MIYCLAQMKRDFKLQPCSVSQNEWRCYLSLPLSRLGAAVAGIYRVAGKNMAPLEALVWGVGQTVLTLIISFSRILATLWGFCGHVLLHIRKQMYRFSENGIVNKGMKLYKNVEGAGQNIRPWAVWEDCPLVFKWLHYRTAPYVPPSQARRMTLREATRKSTLFSCQSG